MDGSEQRSDDVPYGTSPIEQLMRGYIASEEWNTICRNMGWFALSNNNSRLFPNINPNVSIGQHSASGEGDTGKGMEGDAPPACDCTYPLGSHAYNCNYAVWVQRQSRHESGAKLGTAERDERKGAEKVVTRMLHWRGKFYRVAQCPSCMKEKPLLNKVECGKRNLPPPAPSQTPAGTITWNTASYTVLRYEGICSQCTFKVIEELDLAASELRAACAGGSYTEKELK